MGQGHCRLVLSLTVIRSPSPDLTVVGPDSASPDWPGGKFSFLLEFVGTTGTCSHTLSVRHSPRVRVPARTSHYQNAELLTKQSRQLLTFMSTHACPQTRGGPPPPRHTALYPSFPFSSFRAWALPNVRATGTVVPGRAERSGLSACLCHAALGSSSLAGKLLFLGHQARERVG